MDNKEDFKEEFKDALEKSKKVLNSSKKILKNKLGETLFNAASYTDEKIKPTLDNWISDDNFVMKENSRLDKLLRRDPYQYMRLHGTEKSFYKINNVIMYQKNEKGEYESACNQSGTLVFTTRRLTFSVLSNRGALTTYIPIYGRYNYIGGKERDYIVYSIPNFLLTGNFIKKGQFKEEWMPFQKKENMMHWEIERDGILFDFIVDDDFNNKDNLFFTNDLLSMGAEHLISSMIYAFRDTDFYPKWKWEVNDKNMPDMDKELESEERIDLISDLLDNYGYYWFLGKSKTKDEIAKILNKSEEKLETKSEEKDLNLEEEPKIKSSIESSPTKKILDSKNTTEEAQTSSLAEELEKLVSLKEKGLLTEEEFVAAKAKLLK